MRTALTIAGFALAMGGLVGCGGSDSGGSDSGGGMPTDASTSEFCQNFKDLTTDLGKVDPEGDGADAVSALKDAADQMESTGTPSDIPDEARSGLEVTLQAIQGLPDDATLDDITNLEKTLSDAEQKDADAFDTYLQDTCADLG